MATVTSAKLATIASELNTLHSALAERASDFGDVIDSTRAALDLLAQSWRGPVRDDMQGRVQLRRLGRLRGRGNGLGGGHRRGLGDCSNRRQRPAGRPRAGAVDRRGDDRREH